MRRLLLVVACFVALAPSVSAQTPVCDPVPTITTVPTFIPYRNSAAPSFQDALAVPFGLDKGCHTEDVSFMEAQGHEFPTHDLDHGTHFHIGVWRPVRGSGIIPIYIRLTFFEAQGLTFDNIAITWRGGNGKPALPAPWRADQKGVFRLAITQRLQIIDFVTYIDTRADPYNGDRAFEIDLKATRLDTRKASTRGLFGTIYVDNGKSIYRLNADGSVFLNTQGNPVLMSVGGEFGAEYWINSTATQSAPFGYTHLDVRGVPLFANDPWRPMTLYGAFKSTQRRVLLKVAKNPNLHTHPPFYGAGVLPTDQDDPGIQAPSVTSKLGKVSWLRVPLPEIPLVAGDRLLFRGVDTGRDLAGNIVVPEGAGAALFVVTIGSPR